VNNVLQQVLTYTRTMIAELSPPSWHSAGLPAALSGWRRRMRKEGLRVEVYANREEAALSEDRAVMLFQANRGTALPRAQACGGGPCNGATGGWRSRDLRVTVEDRGEGLSADAMQRADEPGHLRLFSVREGMAAMGGRLALVSNAGQGTTVKLLLGRPGTVNDK
jgi:signal transduction histidine kinase